ITADPIEATERNRGRLAHPRIPLPRGLFGHERANARGWNLADSVEMRRLARSLARAGVGQWRAAPVVNGESRSGATIEQRDPADRRRVVGTVHMAGAADALDALIAA